MDIKPLVAYFESVFMFDSTILDTFYTEYIVYLTTGNLCNKLIIFVIRSLESALKWRKIERKSSIFEVLGQYGICLNPRNKTTYVPADKLIRPRSCCSSTLCPSCSCDIACHSATKKTYANK